MYRPHRRRSANRGRLTATTGEIAANMGQATRALDDSCLQVMDSVRELSRLAEQLRAMTARFTL